MAVIVKLIIACLRRSPSVGRTYFSQYRIMELEETKLKTF